MPEEIWKDIPGYDNRYQASNLGRIRSKGFCLEHGSRNGKRVLQTYPAKIIKPRFSSRSLRVALSGTSEGHTDQTVASLVLLAFVGPKPDGMAISRKDSNVLNNRLDNLEYSFFQGDFPEDERWVDIPGYEGMYQASDRGRVRSYPRVIERSDGTVEHRVGKLLHARVNRKKGNYQQVGLCKDGKCKTFYVHSLVALAFIGIRPDNCVICHANGNPQDNRVENLRYDTQSENMRDNVRIYGKQSSGKLTAKDAAEIRRLHEEGMSYRQLANKYGVVKGTIGHVLNGRAYVYIDAEGQVV